MGKKLDALIGRIHHNWAFKMKNLAKLAACRLVMIKNQRQIRLSYARSDVVQLLSLGHQEQALLRVGHLIEEQNKLDAFSILDDYFHVLQEKAVLVEKSRDCPEELKEAMSSLIYAASRCGQFPELQQIRNILTSKFGNEFAVHSLELRKNCRVNPMMIQNLSIKRTSRETILQILREIALDNGIALQSEGMADSYEQDFSDSINRKKSTDSIDENSNISDDLNRSNKSEVEEIEYDKSKSNLDDLRSYKSEVEETDHDKSKSNIELALENNLMAADATHDEGQMLQPNDELVLNRCEDEGRVNVDDMKLLEPDHLDGQDMK